MIELTPDQQRFVESEVAAGGFADQSAVVQAAVEMYRRAKSSTSADEDYERTVRELREAIPEIEAGVGRTIDDVERSIRSKLGLGVPE